MKKQIALGILALAVFVLAACESSPPPPRTYEFKPSALADAEKSENVAYTVTDQQAYGLAKAWVMSKSNIDLRTDDSSAGVLYAEGNSYGYSINSGFRRQYWFVINIFITNGIAKINYSAHLNAEYTVTLQRVTDAIMDAAIADAERRAANDVNELVNSEIASFRAALNR
jgi:hypothetical protein